MKNFATTLFLFSIVTSVVQAQEIVSTSGGVNDVYYSMRTGEVSSVSNTTWDLGFEIKGNTGSILVNGQKGNQVFNSSFTVAQWSSFDTSGYMSWPSNLNSRETWGVGAFNQNPSSAFDLGWGIYNVSTHAVTGDSIFMLTLSGGGMKKIYIKDLTNDVYTFVYADVDGSNELTKTVNTADYKDENFAFYSFAQ